MTLRLRSAFTLVELLVAVVLIDAGLLAIAGATGALVRRQNELRARSAALSAASNRLQLLAATPCQRRGATTSSPALAEYWSEDAPSAGMRELRDSVTFFAAGSEHALVLTTRLPC